MQMQIARKTREAIAKRYKTDYRVGPIATTICKLTPHIKKNELQ